MASADDVIGQRKRRWRSRGGLVTMGTVLSLVAGLGLTVLGLGAADQAVASYDAASWVWSQTKGEVARINGVTARVDTRVNVPKARGHRIQVSQNDRFVIMRDQQTGVISSMDLTSLQIFVSPSPATAGIGVSVALHEDAAFVIDAVQGEVRQLDPRTLTPIGEPLRYPPGITGGVFDGKGRLWIAVPSEGTVSAITAAPLPDSSATGGAGGGQTAVGPAQIRTESVAAASHDLALSTLEDGVAVLDRTTNELTTFRGDAEGIPVTLPLTGPGILPEHTDGAVVPVTVPDTRHVFTVPEGGGIADFTVPGDGSELQPAVAWEGFFYVADDSTGTVHVFDAAGREQKPIGFKNAGGVLELEVRENYLFINAPGASTARVVDNAHQVRVVDKYADDVLGGDPPPTPPDPPPPPKPKKPEVAKPGAPRNVRAAAGNAEVRVSWRAAAANGAEISKYVVVGADKTFQVGANQRSLNVTGLTNGETYRFAVHAVNKKGDGPSRTSNAVRPTAEVPDAPTAATAEAKPDGTVVVNWPAANGQGLEIERYAVTAVSDGTSAPLGEAKGETSLTIKDGELEYGKQYAFTVVAVNERGAGSKASPISNSVVPFTKPNRPENIDAATVSDKAGTIQVTWTAPAENGRPITKYAVAAGGKTTEVTDGTGVTLNGFDTGATVSVEVRAVNEAGESEAASATAKTLPKPVVTVTGSSATFNSATVNFSVNAGGAQATCTVKASGGGDASGSCTSLKVTGLKPSTSYTLTVTAKTAAGTSDARTRTQATDALYGTATCNNGENGETADYCDKDRDGRNGNEIFAETSQQSKQVGWAKPGTRLLAYCKEKGTSIDSYIYNNHKESSWWVQVNYSGKNYIPFAWLNLDGGDDINDLPTC